MCFRLPHSCPIWNRLVVEDHEETALMSKLPWTPFHTRTCVVIFWKWEISLREFNLLSNPSASPPSLNKNFKMNDRVTRCPCWKGAQRAASPTDASAIALIGGHPAFLFQLLVKGDLLHPEAAHPSLEWLQWLRSLYSYINLNIVLENLHFSFNFYSSFLVLISGAKQKKVMFSSHLPFKHNNQVFLKSSLL